ncbi:hypothetical protein PILCRDRAFT_111662 [Piloderma croceum F 1598]|uniref:Uncharacterized protein n=1 Tax=Piloderma croceum (strain F 1598) TaxID=765440 RepID=A0A0C3GKJ3_PILCF|nr:hypothetical protein PILCRDRAFT_111662 [Piloderma croceum F 1598]
MPVDGEDVLEALSNAKKTKVRPSRPVVSANTKEWDTKIRDATRTVLARNSPAGLSLPLDAAFSSLEPEQSLATSTSHQNEIPSESEAEVEAEMSLPGKRQRSQSRLRMSWGPEDFQEDEAELSTIIEAIHAELAPAITRSPLPSSSPTARRLLGSSVPFVPKLSKGKRLRKSDELPCPICLQTPFHLRYRCPVIEAGPDAIEKRLNELKKEDTGHRTLLIEELEHVIRNQKARANLSKSGSSSSPGSFAKSAGNLSPMVPTSSSSGPSSRKLTVPSGSTMSEVTIENKDEGSSNESSDDDEDSDHGDSDEDNVAEKQTNPYKLPPAFAGVASLADVDLEAIIRGPTSQSKSVLDDIPSRSISDDEEAAEDVLEEDEEENDRLYRLRSKKFEKNTSSDEDQGEDLAVPSGEGSGEESGDEEMAITLKPSAQPPQPPENSSRTTQAFDGLNGFVDIEPMDDDGEQTEVAPSAENGEETDESGLSIRKEKKALLAAVLGVVSPFSKGKDAMSNVVPQPESPIEETHLPEDAMDIIEPSQPSAEEMNKHSDRSDPIEPADDLMDSAPQGEPGDASQSRAVSQSPRKPGMAKRMKTRYGKVPFNQAVNLEADRPPVSTSLPGAKAGMKSAEPSPLLGSAVLESARKLSNVEISSSEDVIPPPPVPAVKGPPRRGRPPLSREVKAAREKAKADNKAQKANEKARKTGANQDEQVLQRVEKHDAKKIASPKGASEPRTEGSSTVQPSTPMSIPRNLDPPHSLNKWATIPNSSSPRSGMLVDQLRSSSPGHTLSADDDILSNGNDKQRTLLSSAPENDHSSSGDAVTQHNPLFILSSSQVAFPYSQWQGESYANQAEDSPTESESEDEVPIKSKTKLQPHAPSSVVPKFRRLTDIASQAMFSQDILSSTPFPPTPVVTNKPQKQSDDSDEDEDDGDDTGSDSDTPVKSHIPKSRRAGATLRSKKGGLLSFT